jgi:hypothetical protein
VRNNNVQGQAQWKQKKRGKPSLDKGEVSRSSLLAILPITLHIDPARPWLEIKMSGEITMAEAAGFMREMVNHPDYSDDICGIVDCREMINVMDLKEVRGLADMELQRPGPAWRSRRAVVVGSPDQFSLARMFTVFAESGPVQYDVFYNMETALQWLKE